MGLGIDRDLVDLLDHLVPQRMSKCDRPLDLVAEVLDPDAAAPHRPARSPDVAAGAEAAREEIHVGALVLHLDQPAQRRPCHPRRPDLEELQHAVERLGRAQAVDAGHRGHDEDVAALEERLGRPQPQAVDLLVDLVSFSM